MDYPVREVQQAASFAIIKRNLQKLEWRAKLIVDMLTVKQTYKNIQSKLSPVKRVSIVAVMTGAILLSVVVSPLVRADQYDEQIKAIQQDSGLKLDNLAQLGAEAATIQEEINKLQIQIDALHAQIVANQAKSDDLKRQITEAEAELAKQKKTLGDSIRAMYLEGEISTLEMLASSKDLSDFVDKQQYRESVQNKIKKTVDQITILKAQLKDQQEQVEQLLRDQQAMQNQLATSRSHQSELMSANQSQQSQLNQQLADNSVRIGQLRLAQAAANARLGGRAIAGDPGHGGYPAKWDNAPQDSLIDDWGMYNRECVSYTAWKVYQTYGYMPYWGGHGNANQWPASAEADGIPTGSTPRVHSVAISMNGYYGHAMWVEAVDGNSIYVSQYNYDLAGHYSEMKISASGLIFIYF